MLKCSVKVDQKMQTELNEKIWLTSLICLIVGSIGLGLYIILGSIFESQLENLLLWLSVFPFSFGLVMLISIKKTNRKSSERNLIEKIELHEDHLIEQTVSNGEVVAINKLYYKDIFKVRETENYLFLYINKMSAVPIPKSEFTSEEYSTIKFWVNAGKLKKTNS